MKSRLSFRYYYLFSLLLMISYSSWAQKDQDDLLNYQTVLNNRLLQNQQHPFFKGVIHLKSGDSLAGELSLNNFENKEYSTILQQKNKQVVISNQTIKEVILYADNTSSKTKFYAIKEDQQLYREVYKKDKETIVYDSSNQPFEGKLISSVYVQQNGKLIDTFNFWTSGPKKDLVNYLNKRDGKKYKNRDFKSLDDLFAKL